MAISPQNRARAEELAKQLVKNVSGRYHKDGTPKTFHELEIEAGHIADLVASMVLNENARDLPEEEKCVRCPKCNAVLKKHDPDDDEAMIIQTDHGEAEWVTKGYFCRRCRRSFFPSTC
ncbi:MAG: hypothetical protein AAF802_25635 [Planctomycetota bacterium]